jgi:hypothetical protein
MCYPYLFDINSKLGANNSGTALENEKHFCVVLRQFIIVSYKCLTLTKREIECNIRLD